MTVEKLIIELSKLPQNAEVSAVYDGAARKDVNIAYLSNSSGVCLADFKDVLYYDADRPIGAPTEAQDKYFKLPKS